MSVIPSFDSIRYRIIHGFAFYKHVFPVVSSGVGDELLYDSFPCKEIESGTLREPVAQGAIEVDIGANPSAKGSDEEPPFNKKRFIAEVSNYLELLKSMLNSDQQDKLKKNTEGATKLLLSKL
ncbi:PREDICTED: translationally-controlled tumor protein homolog isoform X2 [Tarenaya hassleriana]|uniref:translationally-controlled tumor protein homolog isoform X2 n=1 Tax=Tarenaya hassleriana TaxID=28532 RepID=UPI00053C19E1|nr:PREDICTED: translationally-controlled tumor protein homolog isoform X2 [Tarenaya hassleriana]